ncbi:MAG: hypothetical protein LLG44_03690, partial [Chloroflexi bacterium]|nr:hypothetical protein [Chloroflexota bacterium]
MYNFDEIIDRSRTDSVKWRTYPPDVLPLWVADMDFRSPQPVLDVLRQASELGVFGYGSAFGEQALLEAWQARLAAHFSWQVALEDLLLLPGVVTGANLACRALGVAGEQALVPAPVYGPLLAAPRYGQLDTIAVPLQLDADGYAHNNVEALECAVTP